MADEAPAGEATNSAEDAAIAAKKDKGFTLVELLIVIVILGILSTVTVFAVRGITDRGQTTACDTDARVMATAYEAYISQYGGTLVPTQAYTTSPGGAGAKAIPTQDPAIPIPQ